MEKNAKPMVTLSRGGKRQRTVDLSKVQIPDLWHIANSQSNKEVREAILEVWHLAHDLQKHICGW